jgi:S-methylmethionine-dependent homocysteine/selenocysteine methylase
MTILLDGATATELQRYGVPVREPWWTSRALATPRGRRVLGGIHAAYVAAGARVLTANTFRTNLRALGRAGVDRAGAARYVRVAVRVAARAAAGRARVAGSVAPVEDCYRPDRVPDPAALRAEHGWLAGQLAAAGVDLILIETMNCVREARIALDAALGTGVPAWVSFVVTGGARLLSGEPLAPAARAVHADGAAAVLVNCATPGHTGTALLALRDAGLPVVGGYPNLERRAGAAAHDHVDRWVPAGVTPSGFAGLAAAWGTTSGLEIIGGCCGSRPAHIAALAETIMVSDLDPAGHSATVI